jgi:hypothetical protein
MTLAYLRCVREQPRAGNKHMPRFFSTTATRSSAAITLSRSEIALSQRQAEDVEALLGEMETIDLLPLSTLVALTEQARAA